MTTTPAPDRGALTAPSSFLRHRVGVSIMFLLNRLTIKLGIGGTVLASPRIPVWDTAKDGVAGQTLLALAQHRHWWSRVKGKRA